MPFENQQNYFHFKNQKIYVFGQKSPTFATLLR